MEMFNMFSYYVGNFIGALSLLMGVVISVRDYLKKGKNKRENKIPENKNAIRILTCLGILCGVGMILYSNSLVIVPNVEGTLYSDAKNRLDEYQLEYNAIQDRENCKVIEQSIEAGSVVKKNTEIILELEVSPKTTPTPTDTPAPTATNTPVPTATNTPVPTATNTPVPTPTATSTPTPTPPHVHDYSWRVKTTKEATCTSEGKKEHVCVCGDYWTETIPMREHSLVTDKAVAATCVATGKTEGSHCSICKYVSVEQKVIPMTDHKYSDESDAYCDYCNAYRATWHYYDQWNNSVYGDWELYKTESEEKVKEKSVTTYTYVVYYWVDPTRIDNERYRATGSRLLPENYEFNKYLTGKESSNYAGITTGTDTYITKDTNKKYNIRQSEIFYSPQTYRYEDPWIIDGIEYWEEIQGSEKQEEKYTEYHYFFRKFY